MQLRNYVLPSSYWTTHASLLGHVPRMRDWRKWLHGPSARLLAMQAIGVTGDRPEYSFESGLTVLNKEETDRLVPFKSNAVPGSE